MKWAFTFRAILLSLSDNNIDSYHQTLCDLSEFIIHRSFSARISIRFAYTQQHTNEKEGWSAVRRLALMFDDLCARDCLTHSRMALTLTDNHNHSHCQTNKLHIAHCVHTNGTERKNKILLKFNHTPYACRERVDRGTRARKQQKQTSDTVEGDGKHRNGK